MELMHASLVVPWETQRVFWGAFSMAPPDLCSKSTLEVADSGREGVEEVLPDLLKAPPDPSNPGLYPGEGGEVCGAS